MRGEAEAVSSNSNSVGGIDGGIIGKLTVREDNPSLTHLIKITQFGPKNFLSGQKSHKLTQNT